MSTYSCCSLLHMWHCPLLDSKEYSKNLPRHQPSLSHRVNQGAKMSMWLYKGKLIGGPQETRANPELRMNPRPSKTTPLPLPSAPNNAPAVARRCLVKGVASEARSLHLESWSRGSKLLNQPSLAQTATGASGQLLPVPKCTSPEGQLTRELTSPGKILLISYRYLRYYPHPW